MKNQANPVLSKALEILFSKNQVNSVITFSRMYENSLTPAQKKKIQS